MKKQYFFTSILLFFITSCTDMNTVSPPVTQDISVINTPIGTKFNCKCEYHKTRNHTYDRNVLKEIANEAYVYALMSYNAYDHEPQIKIPGWKRVDRFETWKGFGADVYLSSTDDLVIAFRGTDGPSINDWFWGNLNLFWKGQYTDSEELFKKVHEKYGSRHITTTGHSLGGGLAMHIAIHNDKVNAYVFDPSPRVFAEDQYDKFNNRIMVISESGEVLSAARKVFTTMKKIKPVYYRYNYLGGHFVKEHGMQNFSQCMYRTTIVSDKQYMQECINKI